MFQNGIILCTDYYKILCIYSPELQKMKPMVKQNVVSMFDKNYLKMPILELLMVISVYICMPNSSV